MRRAVEIGAILPPVDDLKRLLDPLVEADVTSTYQRFQETTRSEDPAAFVQYMVQEGLLRPEDAARAAEELLGAPAGLHDSITIVDAPGRSGSSRTEVATTEMAAVPRSVASQPLSPSRFTLGPEIGSGGMGRVFRAEQIDLARPVAFKRLRKGHDDLIRKRFLREARITAQLDHPSIVPVHGIEVSPDGRSIGYAMKLVEGKTLRAYLNETIELYAAPGGVDEQHDLPKRLEHFLKICDAVGFAHARGILHRDLKPSNFMIGGFNEVWVMDWGIARRVEERDEAAPAQPFPKRAGTETDLTAFGEVIGSLRYMSPEQANAAEIDARADQYALGLVLFELVSLRAAMSSETTEEALEKASTGFKAPLEHVSRRVRIPHELRAIIDKATAIAPGHRYPSTSALAEDVRRYLRGEAVVARPDTVVQRVMRWTARHRRTTLLGALGIVGLAALTIAWTLYASAASELAVRREGDARTAFYIDAASQARAIDAQFQRMEQALEGLRTAAEWALSGPEPTGDTTMYFVDDFADPARRPRDFTKDTTYRWPVSVEFPVVSLSPGTSRESVAPQLRRLAPLRHHIRSMLVGAAVGDQNELAPADAQRVLLQRKGPIDYAYVDLPLGVHVVYPGIEALPPEYDVRTAGFYRMSVNRHGKRWGSPYVDSTTDEQGDDLVLPCTQGLWSPSGAFIGVAGVEITVTKLVETSLRLPRRQTVRTTLVDGSGKKVIDDRDAGRRFRASGKDESIALFDYDLPEIVDAVKKGESGIVNATRDGRALAVSVVKLDVLGWYYVVEVEAGALRGD